MKKLKFMSLLLVAVCIPNLVNAVTPEEELLSCITSSETVCTLSADVTLNSEIAIAGGVTKTINLNGFDINGIDSLATLFRITEGSLTIKGNGELNAENYVFYVNGNTTPDASATKAELNVENGVVATSDTSCVLFIKGKGAKATIDAKFLGKGTDFATISGNGTKTTSTDNGNTEIIINENAHIESTNGMHGIYHPQSGTLTVNGGLIKGATGIEMRSGDLVVNGGTIIATATKTEVKNNGNGSAVTGAAVALAQHTTIQAASITINGGTLEGPSALYETTPENPSNANIVSVEVNGGEFVATAQDGYAVYSENKTGFISGGKYYGKVEEDYADENNGFVTDGQGQPVLVDLTKLRELVEELEEKVGTEEKAAKYTEESLKALLDTMEELEEEAEKAQNQEDVDAIVEKLQKAIDGLETHEEAKARLEKEEAEKNPETSDNIITYVVVALASLAILSTVVLKKKRYN